MVYSGHENDNSLVQFTEDALIVLKHLFLKSCAENNPNYETDRFGALYLMYAMYFKQPTQQYCKFRCTQPEWAVFRQFFEGLETPRHDQARLIFWTLVRADAFRYVEHEYECGFELFMQKSELRQATTGDLVFRNIHNTVAAELHALRHPVTGIVPALQLLQAGYNEMKDHLDDAASMLPATAVMEDIVAGLENIEKIFKIESVEVKRARLLAERRQQVDEARSNTKTLATEALEELTSIGDRRKELKGRARAEARPVKCYGGYDRSANRREMEELKRSQEKRVHWERRERAIKLNEQNMEDVRVVDRQEEEELLISSQQEREDASKFQMDIKRKLKSSFPFYYSNLKCISIV